MDYLEAKRMELMKKEDAESVLRYLQRMFVEDPGSFYKIQVDEKGLIVNIVWADSKMVIDYLAFGDVVCLDTSCKTNNYDLPFAPFVGVNHQMQTVIFGAAIMYEKTSESFEWVFKVFLEAMFDKQPTTILTDQDKAIADALSVVMPNTYHRVCVWYMYQNAMKHLRNIFKHSTSFKEDFRKCMYEYEEEANFLDAWERMLEKYNLRENTWLQQLFDEREKWALTYGRNTFCADMNSTQRSMAINKALKRYLHPSHMLRQFFLSFERVVSDRRELEVRADFKMTQSFPNLLIDVPILVDARAVYSPEIFKVFQEEFAKGMSCIVKVFSKVDSIIIYNIHWMNEDHCYIVTFDSLKHTVECSCKKFEFSGILCAHVVRVIHMSGLTEIPERYILKRWRRDAKAHSVNFATLTSNDKQDSLARYKALSRKLSIIAAKSLHSSAFAMATKEAHYKGSQLYGAKRKDRDCEKSGLEKCMIRRCSSNARSSTPSVSLAGSTHSRSLVVPSPSNHISQESSVNGIQQLVTEEHGELPMCSIKGGTTS